jgi:hypothetical protein
MSHTERPVYGMFCCDNIGVEQIRSEVVDWIHLAHDRDIRQGFCEDGNEPSGVIKCSLNVL